MLHGVGVFDEFRKAFPNEPKLPPPPRAAIQPRPVRLSTGTMAFVIPSLALQGYQNWPPGNSFCNWADEFLNGLAQQLADLRGQ